LARGYFLIFERAINYHLHQEGASVYDIGVRTEQAEGAIGVPEVPKDLGWAGITDGRAGITDGE
jgi:hypothetical protein